MFDHQQCFSLGDFANQRDCIACLGPVHAGHGLVQEQYIGTTGNGYAKIQSALLGIAQHVCFDIAALGQTDLLCYLVAQGLDIRLLAPVMPDRLAISQAPKYGTTQVVDDR